MTFWIGAFGPQAPSAGTFTVDAAGNITDYTAGAFLTHDDDETIAVGTLKLVSHPVVFNMNGYNSGWNMPSEITHQNSAIPAPYVSSTYYMPATVTGSYQIYTPGSSTADNATYQSARFSIGLDGVPAVVNPGAPGLAYENGQLVFTNVFEVTYQWTRDNGTGAVPYSVSWWPGEGGAAGGGDKGGSEGILGLVPGRYDVGYASLEGSVSNSTVGWTSDGVSNNKTFDVVDDHTLSWVKTITFASTDGYLYTLTLTRVGIPEPATMSLLALGGLAMLRRARRG